MDIYQMSTKYSQHGNVRFYLPTIFFAITILKIEKARIHYC